MTASSKLQLDDGEHLFVHPMNHLGHPLAFLKCARFVEIRLRYSKPGSQSRSLSRSYRSALPTCLPKRSTTTRGPGLMAIKSWPLGARRLKEHVNEEFTNFWVVLTSDDPVDIQYVVAALAEGNIGKQIRAFVGWGWNVVYHRQYEFEETDRLCCRWSTLRKISTSRVVREYHHLS